MIQDLLRAGLTRSLGHALISADRLEDMLRPTLERCDLPPEEIERVVKEAHGNLEGWQREVGGQFASALGAGVGAGITVFMRRLGIPSRDEIAALERRVAELEADDASVNSPRKAASPSKGATGNKAPARKKTASRKAPASRKRSS